MSEQQLDGENTLQLDGNSQGRVCDGQDSQAMKTGVSVPGGFQKTKETAKRIDFFQKSFSKQEPLEDFSDLILKIRLAIIIKDTGICIQKNVRFLSADQQTYYSWLRN